MRVLIITAHPDDAELGCGGTMARLLREGHEIGVHVFSESDTIEGNDGIHEEVVASLQGVYNVDFALHVYRTMYFTEQSQTIRNDIYSIKQTVQPDLVITKSPRSLHPDHRVIGEAVESIFLDTTIYAMEGVRDFHNLRINKWFGLEKEDLDMKLGAVSCYKTQINKNKSYFDEDFIRALATVRGRQVGYRYAEGFEVIREVS